ncbi:putative Phosphoglycerate mutase [Desulfosarcina cetonica]|uniref:histidine phosphatase family protein n=1 Tax=Desulfosarcina cetonica TaxID=90730 RepID=UPI0006D22FFC|nr:histidine phosphatase family protein [Desulfosarcina cetonica]VTR70545.1 putative Phosphoglycerate mutase [Desulfosarcina cetonica]
MTEIFFIRHGQASFGQPDYDQLSSLGERQAALLGQHLCRSGIRFDAVYAGGMKRQRQTAEIVMALMNGQAREKLVVDPDFNEFDASDRIIGRLYHVFQGDPALGAQMQRIRTHHQAIGRIFEVARQTQAESLGENERAMLADQFRKRITQAIDKVVAHAGDGQRVAVFTSGGPTAVALRRTLETSREKTICLGWELCNTSVTRMRHEADRFNLVRFNCVAHLEFQNDPSLITYI